MNTQAKAFEGAEGFGASTIGGRGGQVVHVTNLNDSGAGSLRWALEQVSGPRTVVFDVSGAITLKSQVLVENPFVTIAGQTAPDDGITIEGSRIRVKTSEVIVQGLKFRPGDGKEGMAPGDRDGLFIGTTDFTLKNIVVDHNSFSWGIDENVSINGNVKHVTFSNNIVAEGLSKSIHPKGEHSKGLLVSNWDSKISDFSSHITITKNIFASNMERNPEVRAGENIEIVNNLIYNAGRNDKVIAIGGGSSGKLETTVNVIGNVIDSGPSTINLSKNPINLSTMGVGSAVFLSDNVLVERSHVTTQSALVTNGGGASHLVDKSAFTDSGVSVLSSAAVAEHLLQNAGATPFGRDVVDQRIISNIEDGKGALLNSTAGLKATVPGVIARGATDTDRDGMPDWFETRFGMNAKVASSNQDSDKDGFTDLQEYTQGLITGFNIGGAKPEATINAVKGAETFKLAKDGTPAVIKGFDLAEGDKIDLSRLLTDFRDGVDDRNNFVEVTSIAGSTMISVDRDGTASKYGWEFVVELAGVKDAAGVSTAIIPKGDAHPILGLSRVQQTGISGDEQPDRLSGTAGNDTIFGNGGNDKLYGLGGADTLVGGDGDDWLEGGTGADLMYGGSGNDHYVVDSALDMVIEENARGNDAGGRDTVRASISYQLGDNIENLILTGSASISGAGNTLANTLTGNDGANVMTGGDGNDSIRGNAGDDLLRGDAGADLLRGDAGNDTLIGGAGADTLSGGAGRDSFVFDHFPTDGSVDQITDFNVADDEIVIVRAGFKGLGGIEAGAIDAGMLHIGSAATTAEHRFIYDAARGNFLFDADGAGAEAAQLIARIGRVSGLSHDDIMLV